MRSQMKTTLAFENFTDEVRVSPEMPVEKELSQIFKRVISLIGEDVSRDGLIDTPARVSKALGFLTSGYQMSSAEIVGNALFDEPSSELVLVKDIEFFSLCEHHMLPFFGKAHVAYIPNGKVVGLSKIPRLVDVFARRLQVQERLTGEIAREIEKIVEPKGVFVIIEASHLCMMMRGVEKQSSSTVTKSATGLFSTDSGLRSEIFSLLSTKLS